MKHEVQNCNVYHPDTDLFIGLLDLLDTEQRERIIIRRKRNAKLNKNGFFHLFPEFSLTPLQKKKLLQAGNLRYNVTTSIHGLQFSTIFIFAILTKPQIMYVSLLCNIIMTICAKQHNTHHKAKKNIYILYKINECNIYGQETGSMVHLGNECIFSLLEIFTCNNCWSMAAVLKWYFRATLGDTWYRIFNQAIDFRQSLWK